MKNYEKHPAAQLYQDNFCWWTVEGVDTTVNMLVLL